MIMKRFVIPVLAILCLANSCLFENDMAYPVVDDFILSFEVEGQKSVTIDKDSRTVHVELSETADISNLKVTSVVLSDNAQIIGGVPDFLDLSDTLSIDVKVYESKTWRIYASQLVARYINVENQIGEAELDLASRTAIVYVSDAQEISNSHRKVRSSVRLPDMMPMERCLPRNVNSRCISTASILGLSLCIMTVLSSRIKDCTNGSSRCLRRN